MTRSSRPRLKVMMLGLRGVPKVQGGVERHVEELARRLVENGCTVEVVARKPYLREKTPHLWRGLQVTPLPAPRARSFEAIVHTLVGVLYAARQRPDIVHIHAVGPALLVPLARLAGLRIVVTHHGYDYDRAKWGRLARTVLRAGEWAGMRFADRRIAVSREIASTMTRRYQVPVAAIPNGVSTQASPDTADTLARFGLERRRYVVMVSRLVPEKRHLDLIQAFARAGLPGWRLALVGAADHADDYSRLVLDTAERTPGVVATGFQTGLPLRELMAHAGLFVLPSSHEGLPIALLEALGYGLPALASDIPPNREVGLSADSYFPVGDIEKLTEGLQRAFRNSPTEGERAATRARVGRDYDWDGIAERTRGLYTSLCEETAVPADQGGGPPILDPQP